MRARTEADDYAAGESRLCVDCEREGESNPYFSCGSRRFSFSKTTTWILPRGASAIAS